MSIEAEKALDDEWYVVCQSNEVPIARRAHRVQLFGVGIAVWRDEGGGLQAIDDRCVHMGASLSGGQVRDGQLSCPFHSHTYDGSGRCQRVPSWTDDRPIPRGMHTRSYAVGERDGWVFVFRGEVASAPEIPYFEQIEGRFVHHTTCQDWPTNYARMIENQMDLQHIQTVHRTTIAHVTPASMRVHVSVEGRQIRNRFFDGDQAWDNYLHLIYPNIWHNRIGEDFRVMAAFVPLDAGHTRVYLRTMHRFVPRWLGGGLVARLAHVMNTKVLAQDRSVVLAQRPMDTLEATGEKLLDTDPGVIAYRKMHRAHWRALEAAAQSSDSALRVARA